MLTRRIAHFVLLVIVTVFAAALVAAPVSAKPTPHGSGGSSGPGGSHGGWGTVDCGQHPHPGCQLGAGTGGSTGSDPDTGSSGRSGGSGGGSGSTGASGPDPFYCLDNMVPYEPADGTLPPPEGQKASTGGWYVSVCAGDRAGTPGGVYYPPVWVVNGPNAPAPPSPAELARSAYNKLPLTVPTIVLSPAGRQLVNLPTWLSVTGWVAKTATAGVPATASVPGVSVTATATPTSVVWSTGDGAIVTCHGPGTVYTAADDPASASPTCGHTYRASSAGQPGAVFSVTATVHWSVTWSGAGQAGTFPDLTTTATARVPVAESQALTTR